MKTSHFEGSIAYWAATAALERNERTQRELAAFDINPTFATGSGFQLFLAGSAMGLRGKKG
jgi:hypothetical protein